MGEGGGGGARWEVAGAKGEGEGGAGRRMGANGLGGGDEDLELGSIRWSKEERGNGQGGKGAAVGEWLGPRWRKERKGRTGWEKELLCCIAFERIRNGGRAKSRCVEKEMEGSTIQNGAVLGTAARR